MESLKGVFDSGRRRQERQPESGIIQTLLHNLVRREARECKEGMLSDE